MTKQRFHYDVERRQRDLQRRWKLLSRVQRVDAKAAIAWLRSNVRLSADDRAEIASMIEALLLRGRQPDTVDNGPIYVAGREIYAKCCARRAAELAGTGRDRLPKGRWEKLLEEEVSNRGLRPHSVEWQRLVDHVLALSKRKPRK